MREGRGVDRESGKKQAQENRSIYFSLDTRDLMAIIIALSTGEKASQCSHLPFSYSQTAQHSGPNSDNFHWTIRVSLFLALVYSVF